MPDRIIVIGGSGKRRDYFLKAASALGLKALAMEWDEYPAQSRPGDRLKLDPPTFAQSDLSALPGFINEYLRRLDGLAALPGLRFLNHPQAIATVLDKQRTRAILARAGVPQPPAMPGEAGSYEELLALMRQSGISRVFIKPRYGSGAAGVTAFAKGAGGREALYSATRLQDGRLVNCSRIFKSENPRENAALLDFLLGPPGPGVVLERWVPKARAGALFYDLRVVRQFGRAFFMVARGSRGPITNLHLNDMALELKDANLSNSMLEQIENLCARAAALMPGLNCAGLDVLVPAHADEEAAPMIIEINGQGDLIYKDIFAENSIYKAQAQYLASMQ